MFKPSYDDPLENSSDRLITWQQFAKDKNGQKISFFTWFQEITKLIRLHLSREFANGLIEGFISADDAWEKLRNCEIGTFLLRFSESKRKSF